jgi:hypothetical protein
MHVLLCVYNAAAYIHTMALNSTVKTESFPAAVLHSTAVQVHQQTHICIWLLHHPVTAIPVQEQPFAFTKRKQPRTRSSDSYCVSAPSEATRALLLSLFIQSGNQVGWAAFADATSVATRKRIRKDLCDPIEASLPGGCCFCLAFSP